MDVKFKKLRPLCIQALTNFPYIEEDFDALTDYELLCKLGEYVNKVSYNQKIIDENNKEIVKSINELKEYVDEYLTGFNELKEIVYRLVDDVSTISQDVAHNKQDIIVLNQKINTDIENLRIELDNKISENYNILKDYIDYEDSLLNEKIENIEIGSIEVYNPTNGQLQPLQEVINSLYEISNKDGLTASEFDALDLTATNFDAYQITAYDFDSRGKVILV